MDVFCFVNLWMYIICICFVFYSDMYNALAYVPMYVMLIKQYEFNLIECERERERGEREGERREGGPPPPPKKKKTFTKRIYILFIIPIAFR